MAFAAWTSGLLYLWLGSTVAQEPKITILLPAAPVPTIVAELSKASGVPMEATAVLAKDILVLNAHDRRLSDVMTQIAATLNAVWSQDKGTYRLNRPTKEDRAQQTAERNYRMKEISDEIARSKEIRQTALTPDEAKKLRGEFEKLKAKNPRYSFAPYGALDGPLNKAPAQRALLRTIASLDLSDIATMIPGDRIAYSNKPTSLERNLSPGAEDVLAQFDSEQNTWSDILGGPGEDSPPQMADDPLSNRNPVADSPDRILLIASRSNSSALVQFTMYLLAGESTVATSSIWIGSDAVRSLSHQLFANASSQSGEIVTLSPASKAMLDATRGFGRPNSGPAIVAPAMATTILTQPEKTDPLSLVATDGFVSIANAKHEDLIASLPDDLVALNFVFGSNSTLDTFLTTATQLGDLQVSEKDGWIVVRPLRPYSARLLRIDRGALGKYLRSIVGAGRASLDAEAEYALNSQPSDYDTFGIPMGMILDLNSTQNVDSDWIALKIWGSLSKEQRRELINTTRLPFRELKAEQKELVQREAYDKSMKNLSGGPHTGNFNDLRRFMEPTECLPDGLPADGFLELTTKSSEAILASSTTKNVQMSYARLFDEAGIGASLAQSESANATYQPMFDRFQLVNRVNFIFTFVFSAQVSNRSTLHDVVVPPGSVPVPFEGLPKDVQDKISAAKETAKNSPQAQPVRQTPPPMR